MKALVVEDEKLNFDWLLNLLTVNFSEVEVVGPAQDLKQAVKMVNRHQPDLIFLDIKLGSDNGFELFELIPEPFPTIIFTTAHDQFVIDAIRKGAHDYLLKPIRLKELKETIERIDFSANTSSGDTLAAKMVVFKTQGESHFFKVDDILYAQAERAYSGVYTNSKKLILSQPLKEVGMKLPSFFKCHRSFIINPLHVKKLIRSGNNNFLEMSNGEEVPLSDTYLKLFKERYGA